MEQIIQDKINELLIKIRALDLAKANSEIEVKEQELNSLKIKRSDTIDLEKSYQKEVDFLEKMFIKYKELKPVEPVPEEE